MKHENDSHLCQHNPDILYRKICNQIEAIVFEILAKSTGLEVSGECFYVLYLVKMRSFQGKQYEAEKKNCAQISITSSFI